VRIKFQEFDHTTNRSESDGKRSLLNRPRVMSEGAAGQGQ
jgi:hypothetical protein